MTKKNKLDEGLNDKWGVIDKGGKKYLFKPEKGEKFIRYVDAADIKYQDRARRTPAAGHIAGELEVSTPKARYVELNGERGSLQEWWGDLPTLDELRTTDPALYNEIKNSQVKKDLDAFQYIVATLDQHEGNWLVKVNKDGPKKWELIPIDMDASLPPSAQRYTPHIKVGPEKQPPLPATITREFYTKLKDMSDKREALRNALSAWLKPPEIEGVIVRLDELMAKTQAKPPNPPEIKILD